MRIIVLFLFVFIANSFALIGQDLDTICDGRDFWSFCLVKEKIPDTIWMDISDTVEITLTIDLDIEYDQKEADASGWSYARVRQARSIWAAIKTPSGTKFPYTRYFSDKWMCYGDIPPTDTIEMEQIIEAALCLAYKSFVGYPCKTRGVKVRRDNTGIPKKRFIRKHTLYAYVHLWVFPKENNVDLY